MQILESNSNLQPLLQIYKKKNVHLVFDDLNILIEVEPYPASRMRHIS